MRSPCLCSLRMGISICWTEQCSRLGRCSWRGMSNAGFGSPSTCRSQAPRAGSGLFTSQHHGERRSPARMTLATLVALKSSIGNETSAKAGSFENAGHSQSPTTWHPRWSATHHTRCHRTASRPCISCVPRARGKAGAWKARAAGNNRDGRHGCIDRGTGAARAGSTETTRSSAPPGSGPQDRGTPAARPPDHKTSTSFCRRNVS